MTRPMFLAVMCMLAAATATSARDLVIDNVRGSDSQNDRGLVAGPASYGPYRSINRALLVAQRGDRIVLTDTGQPYRECISLVGPNHSGSPAQPFEIIGNGATLDGTVMPAAGRWQPIAPDLWQLENTPPGYPLLLSGGQSLTRVRLDGSGDLSRLRPLQWTLIGPRMFLRTEPNRGPMDYPLEVTDQTTGITLYDVRHVVVRDLVVRGYRLDGINAHDRNADVTLLNIASRQNGRAGITVAGASTVTIGATLCEQNGQAQLRVEGRGVAQLGRVDLADDVAPRLQIVDAGRTIELPQP